jgi:hypothetical protein
MDAFAGPKFYAKIYLDSRVITIFVPWGVHATVASFSSLKVLLFVEIGIVTMLL